MSIMRGLLGIAPLILVGGCVVTERVERIPAREPVSAESIVADLAVGAPEAQIAAEIREHGVPRPLTPDDVIVLKRAGASDTLVIEVLRAPVTTPRPARRIVHRTISPDWDAVGQVVLGALHITGELAAAAFRCR